MTTIWDRTLTIWENLASYGNSLPWAVFTLMLWQQVKKYINDFLVLSKPFFFFTATFAKSFKESGMHGYVTQVQRQEREHGVDVLQHQKWSGATFVDEVMKMVTGGMSATAAMGKGVTEDQFKN